MKKKKKHVYNKSTGRSYEYDQKYQSTPKHKRERAERNRARADILEYLTKRYGKEEAMRRMRGKDVDHVQALKKSGVKKKRKLRLRSIKSNRGDKTY